MILFSQLYYKSLNFHYKRGFASHPCNCKVPALCGSQCQNFEHETTISIVFDGERVKFDQFEIAYNRIHYNLQSKVFRKNMQTFCDPLVACDKNI